jgi:hypothetical protein
VAARTIHKVYKPAHLARARENLARHSWARRVVDALRVQVAPTLEGGRRRSSRTRAGRAARR